MRRKLEHGVNSPQDARLPKYTIGVASEISGVPQQQLRRMEENGLISPARTSGNTRRYSDEDLAHIAAVASLSERGSKANNIRLIRNLEAEIATLRAENERLRHELQMLTRRRRKHSSSAADTSR